MKQSRFYIPTTKQAPSDAQIASHQILIQGGYMKQTAAGIYTLLPLGNKIIENIKNIIREEMDAIDAAEVFMPVLQPEELWIESGRIDDYGPNLMTMKDRHERKFALGPTHEEVVTDVIRDAIKSYKKLPLVLYQIQTKFRDEMRPRFGLMRGREFMMYDGYSFTANNEDLDTIYEQMEGAYRNIFTRSGITFRQVDALAGEIGGSESSEFQALSSIGEDVLVYNPDTDFAANLEVFPDIKEGDASPDGKGTVKFAKGIEIGHIFKLGTNYSEKLGATITTSEGTNEPIIMGCYGIGVSRMIMAILEQHQVDNVVTWPESVAPFTVHLLLGNSKNEEQVEVAEKLYKELQAAGIQTLYDDRDERLGAKFGDADLIGLPHRIVVGRGVTDGVVEYSNRIEDTKDDVAITNIVDVIKENIK